MINPSKSDVGRKVVYRARPDAEPEEGELSSIGPNPSGKHGFVFVRFRGPSGEMTPCRNLEWIG